MSYLSLALTDALALIGQTQTALAETAKLHPSQVNKASKGKPIGCTVMHALAHALPLEHRGSVIAGWLKDQLSADALNLVEIYAVGNKVSEIESLPTLPPELDAETRSLILWLANQAVRHTTVCDAIKSLKRAVESVAG